MRAITVCLTAALLAGAIPAAAQAGTVVFTGTRSNVDAPGPAAARCGTRNTTNIRPSANSTSIGASNLGSFTPLLTHCIQLPLSPSLPNPFDLGEFTFDFGNGNTLVGTYAGTVTFNAPGLFDIAQTHIVTGGTGRFLNATGGFNSAGTLSFRNGPPFVQQSFNGTLSAPAIPEPASWALMISGFGLAGAAMRRRTPASALA